MIKRVNNLEDICKVLGSKKPFQSGSITTEGSSAYEQLVSILDCVGKMTSSQNYMSKVIGSLDDIVDKTM